MNIKDRLQDAPFIFRVLRAATLAAGLLGSLLALILGNFGLFAIGVRPAGTDTLAGFAGLAAVVGTSALCWEALLVFYRLCGRLARGSAFTLQNACAMRRIAQMLLGAGLCVLAGVTAVGLLARGLGVTLFWLSWFALAFFGASLLAHALSVLIRRAACLQQDSDLTI